MDATYNQLIDRIYATIQEPDTLLDTYKQLALHGGGFAAHYVRMDMQRRIVLDTRISHEALLQAQDDYAGYYVSVDQRVPWYSAGTLGEWRADQHTFDEQHVRRTEIYRDFLRPIGIKRMVVCKLSENGTQQEVLCVPRPYDGGDFDDTDLQRLAFFSGHLVRAAQLRARLDELQTRQAAADAALDHLPYGTLWVNASGRIVWMSPSAQALLAQVHGLRTQASRLQCIQPELDHQLQRALTTATRPAVSVRQSHLEPERDTKDARVRVTSLRTHEHFGNRVAKQADTAAACAGVQGKSGAGMPSAWRVDCGRRAGQRPEREHGSQVGD